ncbi:pantoate--beta-alanine ligase [Pengzhenrongella frigida]|uniref:Pantothenate synthetase n=1 Tax=Pengzhenrongella frigida TaxID=1259133 RepID=A0A4Q5MWC4_9MICO|nr:pantoate--beta-alanine ligase [Cellulomonas sp. HLT2-17]RYV49972.1 pantoate--beta-alanine ligase [Cellulomonas sp. HLT2-17]
MTPPDPLVAPRASRVVRGPNEPGNPRPVLVRTRAELAAALAARPVATGKTYGRAVVMTMGALHQGHLSLVRRARELADQVVVTIFVNPLQFGVGEDLGRYPRDLEGDLDLLASVGADLVFAPTPDVMFPDGDPVVRVTAGPLGEILEGVTRPGHLDGVLTVVLKLMHLTRPDVSVFGQKDAQQVMAVERMVCDLDVPVKIVAAPTVRDTDGLALSSRNAFLSPAERARALVLSRALGAGERATNASAADADAVRAAARGELDGADVELDYLALVDPRTALEVPAGHQGAAVLAVAARVGVTRLIDNVPLWLGEHEENDA